MWADLGSTRTGLRVYAVMSWAAKQGRPTCRAVYWLQKKKDKDPQRRQVAAAIVAAAALAGLRKLQKAGKAAAPPELALRVKALADEVAEESSSSPALQRAAADLYAAAAALAPDNTLAVQLVRHAFLLLGTHTHCGPHV